MTYTVYYKGPRQIFWHKIRRVEGDVSQAEPLRTRVILREDGTRYELPETYALRFSRERFLDIQQKMSKEAGTKIEVKQ